MSCMLQLVDQPYAAHIQTGQGGWLLARLESCVHASTMIHFMWQADLHGVAMFITECLGVYY